MGGREKGIRDSNEQEEVSSCAFFCGNYMFLCKKKKSACLTAISSPSECFSACAEGISENATPFMW